MWLTGCESLEAVKESDLQKQVTFVNRLTYSYANLLPRIPRLRIQHDSWFLLAQVKIGFVTDCLSQRLTNAAALISWLLCSASNWGATSSSPMSPPQATQRLRGGRSQRQSLSKMLIAPFYGLFDTSWLNTSKSFIPSSSPVFSCITPDLETPHFNGVALISRLALSIRRHSWGMLSSVCVRVYLLT